MINGVDYASIDGNKPPMIEGSKVDFAIVRGAYTDKHGAAVADDTLARDRDSWAAHKIPFGSYLILSYGGLTAKEQFEAFATAYGDRRPGELPPWIDAETNSNDHSATADAKRLALLEEVYDLMMQRYGIVGIYTSCNQWSENFGNKPSRIGGGPLWLKVPYPWKEHNLPHPEACPSVVTDLPIPWRNTPTAGAWLVQYQGDAKGAAGFSSTVDLNGWLPVRDTAPGLWVRQQLARHGFGDIRSFQRAGNLVPDGVVGPKTFAALTYFE